jgi:hypothetical protein
MLLSNFVMALRSDEAKFLDTHPVENHVLNVIARRARRTPCRLTMLDIGECFIGHKGLGITEQQYRTAKKNLKKWGFVEFKKGKKATDTGTVAKLLNSTVYDINEEEGNGTGNGRPTEDQRKGNGRVTTNNNDNNVNNEKNDNKSIVPAKPKREKFSSGDMAFVDGMLNLLLQSNPKFKQPNKNTWAEEVRKIREIDGIDHNEMARVFTWANKDQFWSSNILSPGKLRKQWNQLSAKANQQQNLGGMSRKDASNIQAINGDW